MTEEQIKATLEAIGLFYARVEHCPEIVIGATAKLWAELDEAAKTGRWLHLSRDKGRTVDSDLRFYLT